MLPINSTTYLKASTPAVTRVFGARGFLERERTAGIEGNIQPSVPTDDDDMYHVEFSLK